MKEIAREAFIPASFNQDSKVFCYKIQDAVSYGLDGLIAAVTIIGIFIFHNIDSIIAQFLRVCLVIAEVAVGMHIIKGIVEKFKEITSRNR